MQCSFSLNSGCSSKRNSIVDIHEKLGLGLWVSMNWVITHTHCHGLAGTVHKNQTLHFVIEHLGFVHWVGDTKGSIEELYITMTELQSAVTGLDYKLGSISEKQIATD
ncbi:unnamed protein product [Prunus armeniaca]